MDRERGWGGVEGGWVVQSENTKQNIPQYTERLWKRTTNIFIFLKYVTAIKFIWQI